MPTSKDLNTVGVIVARFQVVDLHKGHRFLIEYALERHHQVMIVLGSRGGMLDDKDFLPFDMRKDMVLKSFPSVTVVELLDHPISHDAWSVELDDLIARQFPEKKAALYGSRKSFIESYSGHLPTVEVPQIAEISGTKLREEMEIPNTREVRMGMLKAARLRYATSYATTDLAILSADGKQVLLIGRNRELGKLRFPGGFADPTDDSYEATAAREGSEEIPTVHISGIRYIGSKRIDDRRYRGSRDGIKTSFFVAQYTEGEPTAGDDADTVQWVEVKDLLNVLVKNHKPLGEMLLTYLREQ